MKINTFKLKKTNINLIQSLYFLMLVLFINSSHAQTLTKEDKIKASYVFNSIRFISWPENVLAVNTLNVCAISESKAFSNAFKPVVGRKVKGNLLKFYHISIDSQINHCNVLFLDKTAHHRFIKLKKLIQNKKILFISDIKNFCNKGGMIGLAIKKGKMKLEINLDLANSAGFNISSNLLEVATIVSSQE